MKFIFPLFIIFLTNITYSIAQEGYKSIPFLASNWIIPDDVEASFESFEGRSTIVLQGNITAQTPFFTNGVIEVDVYANEKRSFAGITFRKNDGTSEEVYLRTHKSKQADAVQYTPIYNLESTWQLYHNYQANVKFLDTGWNTLRIEVQNSRADVYINGKRVIAVDELKTDNLSGSIGLFSLFENRFSNFRYKDIDVDLKPVEDSNQESADGILTIWDVSDPVIYNESEFSEADILSLHSVPAYTEKSGLLPISKYIIKPSSGNFERNNEVYTVASQIIEAEVDEIQRFSFDYSDKIIVYLNGKKLFFGNNAFRAKGIQFKGSLNVETNQLYLPLKQGENLLQCVVIDRANGWGLIGKLD